MGDMGDAFKVMNEIKRERHAEWKKNNREVLEQSGLKFTVANKGEAFLFRAPGKPKVDFYPSTGRWRVGNMSHNGGAWKFLKWYVAQ